MSIFPPSSCRPPTMHTPHQMRPPKRAHQRYGNMGDFGVHRTERQKGVTNPVAIRRTCHNGVVIYPGGPSAVGDTIP